VRKISRVPAIVVMIILVYSPSARAKDRGITDTSSSPHVKLRCVDLDDVRWTKGFWAQRFELCRRVMIPGVERALHHPQNAASLDNFLAAAGLRQGEHRGRDWSDGDCYKWLEAVAHVYAVTKDESLDKLMDHWIEIIAKAQAADGYLSTNIQLSDKQRLVNPHFHEMYNMGHLLTAACIHHRATGKDSFLRVARKLGDFLYKTFQPRPTELAHFGWNPSNIMGLAELYRTTRDPRYRELAGIFVDMRGSAPGGSDLTQDHVPLGEETEAVGHCVCATYLYCGAADVFAETGEPALRDALERIWQDVVTRKTYITGANAALPGGTSIRGDSVHEAFGPAYFLPNRTAYNETCATIGNAMWNWRMLAMSGEAKYADVIETVLYNGMLSAVGVEGKDFFYANPLRCDRNRQGLSRNHTPLRWTIHRCYCCPVQVIRTIAKLHGWVYCISDDGVWVNLYGGSVLRTELPDGSEIGLSQQSDYPWEGRVKITIDRCPPREFAVRLRIPGWCRDASIRVNGRSSSVSATAGTYVALRRHWVPGDVIELDLPMPVRLIEAHPAVEADRNQVAVMRGPVVYCLELPLETGGEETWARGVYLPENVEFSVRHDRDFLGGVTVLEAAALTAEGRDRFIEETALVALLQREWPKENAPLYREFPPRQLKRPDFGTIPITLIPYYAWANRGESNMEVWIPLARTSRPGGEVIRLGTCSRLLKSWDPTAVSRGG